MALVAATASRFAKRGDSARFDVRHASKPVEFNSYKKSGRSNGCGIRNSRMGCIHSLTFWRKRTHRTPTAFMCSENLLAGRGLI